MKKFALFLSLFVLLLSAPPFMLAQETKKIPSTENEQPVLTLTINGNGIRVQNADNGEKLEVYNVLGVKVTSITIDSSDKSFLLTLPKGCYILKIANIVRRTVIK